MHRPVGVSILGWLAIAWGVVAIALGVLGVLLGLYATSLAGVALNSGLTAGAGSFALGLVVVALSALGAIVGLGDIVFGIGALRLAGWAWVFGQVLMIVTVVLNLAEALAVHSGVIGSLIGAVIAGAVLYYLYRPNVLAAFGRVAATSPPQPDVSVGQPLVSRPRTAPRPPEAPGS